MGVGGGGTFGAGGVLGGGGTFGPGGTLGIGARKFIVCVAQFVASVAEQVSIILVSAFGASHVPLVGGVVHTNIVDTELPRLSVERISVVDDISFPSLPYWIVVIWVALAAVQELSRDDEHVIVVAVTLPFGFLE